MESLGTSNFGRECRTKSDDEIRHLRVNATTWREAENNVVVGVVGLVQDVAEAVQERDRAVAGVVLEQLIDTANAPSNSAIIAKARQ